MKLWLDDERPAPEGWTPAKTVLKAIELVMNSHGEGWEWTDASLDHDLGGDNTGLDFIDWMIENGWWPTNKPTVHSANPVGAERMRMAIDRYFNTHNGEPIE